MCPWAECYGGDEIAITPLTIPKHLLSKVPMTIIVTYNFRI